MNLSTSITWFDRFSTRVHRRVQSLQSRVRYRLGVGGPHPGNVSIASSFRHPVSAVLEPASRQRYRDLFPNAIPLELAEAARLKAHRFTLLGHTMEFGDRMAWSRDPVSRRDWPRVFSPDISYRGPGRLGDVKFPWELNKHQYFFTLGKAAWLTGDRSFADEIVRQIDHWIEDNPYQTGINWSSALETGTRAVSWIMAYPFFQASGDARFQRRLTRSLAHHLLFVEQHLSTGPFANTHLVGEAAVLVVGGLFLDCGHSTRWVAKGLAILEEEIGRQVTADGVHAERSVAYHRFFLDHYYLVAGLLAANGRTLTAATLSRMERMTAFLMHALFPDGTAPSFGDNDDARGLWFRADCPTDYRGLLALGAVLFERGDFKLAAEGVQEEVFWLLGLEGAAAFDALPSRRPEDESTAYPEGGYYVMRGGWRASDPVLVFDCGPVGFGPAGHGHADTLSYQLHAAGYTFLVDPGAFSYNLDYEWRENFRSTRAHNIVVVDDQDQSVPRDRMSWKTVAHSRLHGWVTTPWFDLIDGEHDGYKRLPDPVAHRRVVLFLKPDLWIVWDSLTARQRHRLELLLHVRPDCGIEMDEESSSVLLTSPDGRHLNVWTATGTDDRVMPNVIHGSESERAAWFSPAYGTRVPSRALSVTHDFVGECALVTALSTAGHRTTVTPLGAAGFHVHRHEESEEDFYYLPEGKRSADIKGARFDGQLFFRRRSANAPTVAWARSFREISLEGMIDVRATTLVNSLVLDEHRRVVIDAADSAGLHITAHDGVQVVVNGRPFGSADPTC